MLETLEMAAGRALTHTRTARLTAFGGGGDANGDGDGKGDGNGDGNEARIHTHTRTARLTAFGAAKHR